MPQSRKSTLTPFLVEGHAGVGIADDYGSPLTNLAQARDAIAAAFDKLDDMTEAIYSSKEQIKGTTE